MHFDHGKLKLNSLHNSKTLDLKTQKKIQAKLKEKCKML